MKKFIVLAVAAAACYTSAFAQVSNFTGYSAGVNLDHTAVTTKLSAGSATIDGLGQQSVGATVYGAYGVAVDSNTVINIGATYGLTNAKGGSTDDGTGPLTAKAKNQYSLYVEPGMLLNDKTLAYGKISYNSAKMELDAQGDVGSKSVNGLGYGLGIRTMLDKNMSLNVEIKRVNYGTETVLTDVDFKTTATVGSIGIGYKF